MPSFKEVMIAWNRDTSDIVVGPWPDLTNWSRPYRFTVGACFLAMQKMNYADLSRQVFLEFNAIVISGGVDPKVAHKAFLAVDEYRNHCARDLPGVTEALRRYGDADE